MSTGAVETLRRLGNTGISLEQATDKLLADGVDSFAQSYDKLPSNIAEKTASLVNHDVGRAALLLEPTSRDVIATLADLIVEPSLSACGAVIIPAGSRTPMRSPTGSDGSG